MNFEHQLDDMVLIEELLNNTDENTKYKIFFKDVLSHHDEMIAKEEKYANEYISILNPLKELSFWKTVFSILYIGLIIVIAFLFTTSYGTVIDSTISNLDERLLMALVVPIRDSKGYLCESGGVFHDGKGNICESGGLFYDARGNLCDSNSCYYDSKGNLCEPGGVFHDADGNMIDPGG